MYADIQVLSATITDEYCEQICQVLPKDASLPNGDDCRSS
jgi:hypothetical protein